MSFWDFVKKWLGPAFVLFEAVMHVYILAYLVLGHDALLVIGYTAFELVMFIYLLFEKRLHGDRRVH